MGTGSKSYVPFPDPSSQFSTNIESKIHIQSRNYTPLYFTHSPMYTTCTKNIVHPNPCITRHKYTLLIFLNLLKHVAGKLLLTPTKFCSVPQGRAKVHQEGTKHRKSKATHHCVGSAQKFAK